MKKLSEEQQQSLLITLEKRFRSHPHRHPRTEWSNVLEKLMSHSDKLWSLHQMEVTSGEPDVVAMSTNTGEIIFVDCSPESPQGRRSLCYDHDALMSRKKAPPKDSAQGMADAMRITLLDETQYRRLQELGNFDTKTSSWIATPDRIRELGGALFGDKRYETVFFYHNGADSYYAARGFRGFLSL